MNIGTFTLVLPVIDGVNLFYVLLLTVSCKQTNLIVNKQNSTNKINRS